MLIAIGIISMAAFAALFLKMRGEKQSAAFRTQQSETPNGGEDRSLGEMKGPASQYSAVPQSQHPATFIDGRKTPPAEKPIARPAEHSVPQTRPTSNQGP